MNGRKGFRINGACSADTGSLVSEEPTRTSSYRDIFKATSVLGGANALVIVIRMARAKAIALLIGPEGYGLAGLFLSTIDLVGTGTRFGLQSAGVREIASAAGKQDEEALGRVIQGLRVAVLLSGVLGASCMIVFARQISRLTFGNENHAWAIAVLSGVVLVRSIAQGQFAILQGLRRIRDLAFAKVLGAVFGTVSGITLLAIYGLRGIVPLIIAGAVFSLGVSGWFFRRARPPLAKLSLRSFVTTISPLLALGFTFFLTGLANRGMGYAARVIVGRNFGVEGVGMYSAAWGVSGMFVGFVLQAMGTDFYPRLCAVAKDAGEMRRLVNEQITVGALMAFPGILFFLALAPYLIRVFYSAKFLPATNLLIFMLLGMAVRVVAWPLGYVKIAMGKKGLFLLTEVGFVTVYLVALWSTLPVIGLVGAGVGWFITYLLLLAADYFIGRRLIGFRWSRESRLVVAGGALSCASSITSVMMLPRGVGAGIATAIAAGVSIVSVRRLQKLLGVQFSAVVRNRMFGK